MVARLMLLDVPGWIYQSHFAMPNLTTKAGRSTGAVVGYASILYKFLRFPPDKFTHVAAAFESPDRTNWRRAIDPSYKANRDGSSAPALDEQYGLINEITELFGVTALRWPGAEADDIIATYARRVRRVEGEAVIVSQDKDLMQLMGRGIRVWCPPKGPREGRWLSEADVFTKFGVSPRLVPDVQALAGDAIDGFKGIPGFGPVLASRLVGKYGSLEKVIEAARLLDEPFAGTPRERGLVCQFAALAETGKRLATLHVGIEIDTPLDALARRPIDHAGAAAFMRRIEADNFAERLENDGVPA